MDCITEADARPLKRRALVSSLNVEPRHQARFRELVRAMLADGAIALGPGRTLVLPAGSAKHVGVFKLDSRGFGIVVTAERLRIRVPRGKSADAADGDTVLVESKPRRAAGQTVTGRIVAVLKQADQHWVGTLVRRGERWLVYRQERRAAVVEVDPPGADQARDGDLVVVKPKRAAHASRTPRGMIVERIGRASSAKSVITGVMRRLGIPDEFPRDVCREARDASRRFRPCDAEGRVDLRETCIITIDPVDARDFDDAISVRQLDGGSFELGVHIADVAHFVQPGSRLDVEARARGTSVYFPGRVVPMLPEVLSNGVCSLQPHEPRLTKSAFIVYDKRGAVTGARFCNSLIESRKRFTYAQVDRVLATKKRSRPNEWQALLQAAEKLARLIRTRRLRNGMLVLNMPEVDLRLDVQGAVCGAEPADRGFSHTLIEMFMVEANDAVSRALAGLHVPHLRRVHPPPDADGLTQLTGRLRAAGCAPPGPMNRGGYQKLLESVRGRPAEPAVNLLLLRSFGQAVYSPEPVGHFALASDDYCHFTSPIRRYPDLTIHRLFEQHLTPEPHKKPRRSSALAFEALTQSGQQLSTLERRAQEAERAVRAELLLEMMKSKVGQTFDGLVTGVCSRGLFVQVTPFLAEGFVRLSDLPDDRWICSRENATLIGRRTRRTIAIGQPLRVIVDGVDPFNRDMSLRPADDRIGVVAEGRRDARRSARAATPESRLRSGRGRGGERPRRRKVSE